MAVIEWDGATRNINARVFKMFLFLNGEKVKTMVTM